MRLVTRYSYVYNVVDVLVIPTVIRYWLDIAINVMASPTVISYWFV